MNNRKRVKKRERLKKIKREKEIIDSTIEVKLERKQKNFYAKAKEIKRAMFSNQLMIVLLYNEALLNTNELDPIMPSSIVFLLQKFEDVFLDEMPNGLPPIWGIEHHIDSVPGASIPNRPV